MPLQTLHEWQSWGAVLSGIIGWQSWVAVFDDSPNVYRVYIDCQISIILVKNLSSYLVFVHTLPYLINGFQSSVRPTSRAGSLSACFRNTQTKIEQLKCNF